MWGVTPSSRWNWEELRAKIRQHGVRNSLLVAPMPTASTSQILGNNEVSPFFTFLLFLSFSLSVPLSLSLPGLQHRACTDVSCLLTIITQCFEPYTSNLYVRRTLAGEFVVVNPWLLKDLIAHGLWDEKMKNKLIAANGSVQLLPIPQSLKDLYKTVWEIKGKTLIDMAADRGAFIDQSQSFNVHMPDVNFGKLTSMHFYAWKKGTRE